jgi:hypothetical protein
VRVRISVVIDGQWAWYTGTAIEYDKTKYTARVVVSGHILNMDQWNLYGTDGIIVDVGLLKSLTRLNDT